MKPLRYRPIALALLCLFAKAQMARAATNLAVADATPGRAAYAAATPDESAPPPQNLAQIEGGDDAVASGDDERGETDASPDKTTISAEKISGQADEITRAKGDVRLRTKDTQMFADEMDYYLLEDEIRASGNVRVFQEGAEVSGPYLQLKIAEKIGYLDDARYRISRFIERPRDRQNYLPGQTEALPALPARLSAGYGQAARIHFDGENQFRIENGTYSTCKPDADVRQDWFAKSGDIKLDYDENNGVARDATLYFKDVPFLYMPYLSFSLNNQRKSGVLAPTFSSSTRTGLDLSIPYYWNIAPNYDATIEPRIMSKRGLQIGTEIRYKDHYADSEARLEILPRDKQYAERRYAFDLRHAQN
ncbi:MAG: hypothetical protein LBD06_10950, partial [Candidatus Accumulibacter sp.]|nr:hypothetical protein [Accumulibacter sp.]